MAPTASDQPRRPHLRHPGGPPRRGPASALAATAMALLVTTTMAGPAGATPLPQTSKDATLSPTSAAAGRGTVTLPGAANCPIFPADNVWNTPVSNLPVDPRSGQYIAAIGPGDPLHPDFGRGDWDGEPMGIPFNVVAGTQPKVPVSFMYASESNPGPYPIPAHALIEGGPSSSGDRHVIVVDTGTCTDYEMWASYPKQGGKSWHAGSGATFPLESNQLRPATWTSADAAGLPVLPGLVVASEDQAGAINHAIRVTVPCTDTRFIWPARHEAGVDKPNCPPMGLRLRLKASVDISGYPRMDRVILQALKTYGMIVADNGSPWFISGAGSNYWDNDTLHDITRITGSAFQVVNESCLEVSPGSAQADPAHC